MSQRGRPPRRWVIRRLRLINFHNFVDETIEVRDGGHLFLLGDNGSGKTTVLDAVHYVLGGGQDLELNAAARIGGRREEGRTIQGVVLRYDAERGVVNEGGAIAYAIVELGADDGEVLCLGVGVEATTLEARPVRWGLVTRATLETLPVVVAEGDGRRPATRDELRAQLPRSDSFGQLAEYRKVVAERLFGGESLYQEVCRFWSMAKAYREIVSGARDFGTLFQRLLPAPDSEVFVDILRSLRAIDALEVALREIDAQREHVAGLVALSAEIDAHRDAASRYRWLLAFRALGDARRRREWSVQAARALELDLERLDAEVQIARARCDEAEQALRACATAEGEALVQAIAAAESKMRERAALAEQARIEAEEEQRAEVRARQAVAELRTEEAAALADVARALAELGLPGARRESLEGAERDAAALSSEARRRAQAAAAEAEARAAGAEALRAELAALADRREEEPAVDGFAAARARLLERRAAAVPLYQALEPAADADPEALAALEAIVGEEALATIVTATHEREGVRASVHAVAPTLRVVVKELPELVLPGWVERLFQPGVDGTAAEARRALALALSQPEAFGELAPPADGVPLVVRGAAFFPSRAAPRLLGADARTQAHAARVEAARGRLGVAEEAARAMVEHAQRLDEHAARLDETIVRLHAARRRIELELAPGLARADERAANAALRRDETAGRHLALAARADEAEKELRALRARADTLRIDEALRLQAELRARIEEARGALETASAAAGARREALSAERAATLRVDEEIAAGNAAVQAAATALRARRPGLDDDAALEHEVRVTQRGDQFRTQEAIAERLSGEERQSESKADELERDGSRGVRNLQYAPRFGFEYERSANRLSDRRGQPAAGVLAQIDHELAEQRDVVNARTHELMDTLVMGQLARHLQDQVERLHRMVKEINRLLGELSFGTTRYQFVVAPRADRSELVELVRRVSLVDEESRRRFRAFIDERVPELKGAADDDTPELLDYRRWFDYRLRMRTQSSEGVELERKLRVLGSGGEQGVPNYLLVLALAKLMFDNAEARLRPLLFDEAFYGIDAGRRDQLLRFATQLGLQLFVASPDQDGVTPAVRYATTLFVVKDRQGDVHLAPYHYWNLAGEAQPALFDQPPDEPADADAVCVVSSEPE